MIKLIWVCWLSTKQSPILMVYTCLYHPWQTWAWLYIQIYTPSKWPNWLVLLGIHHWYYWAFLHVDTTQPWWFNHGFHRGSVRRLRSADLRRTLLAGGPGDTEEPRAAFVVTWWWFSPRLQKVPKMGIFFFSDKEKHQKNSYGFHLDHLGVELMVWNTNQQRGWDWNLILWEVSKFLEGEAIKARKPGEKPHSWPSWVQLNKWMAGRSWSSPDFWVPGSTHW